MCTVVILYRPEHAWPVILAANRDEMLGRSWSPPGRHWLESPSVVAGQDHQAGGSWLGGNDDGVFAAILNRHGSLGASLNKRSRGELVLTALNHATAKQAATTISKHHGSHYRSFNMIIADKHHCFWLRSLGERRISINSVPSGVSMSTAWDLNDSRNSERTSIYLPRFQKAAAPRPDEGDWHEWRALMESTERGPGSDNPNSAMTVKTDWGFGTVSRSLIAISNEGNNVWLFSSLYPNRTTYEQVSI